MFGPLNIKCISNTAIAPILLFTTTLRYISSIVCHMGFILFMSSVFIEHIVAYIHFQTDETASQEGPWLCRKCMLQNSSSLDKASRSVTRTWWETRDINRQASSWNDFAQGSECFWNLCHRGRYHRATSDRAWKETVLYIIWTKFKKDRVFSILQCVSDLCATAVMCLTNILACSCQDILEMSLFHWTGFQLTSR